MSKEKRDENRREMHIERNRERREAAAHASRRRGAPRKPRTTRARTRTDQAPNQNREPTPAAEPRDDYSARLSSLKSELNSLSFRTRNIPNSVNTLENNINDLATRIQNIRENNYHSQKRLDKMIDTLSQSWNNNAPNIQSISLEQSNQLLQRQNNLEASLNRVGSSLEVDRYGAQLSDLSRDLITIETMVRSQLDEYQSQYQEINNDLRTAEETVANLSNSSIKWKNNEHPVLSVNVTDLSNDKKGVLTLTNQRIIFEEVREEVLRKTLFIATEKRTIHEVVLDQPIGSIEVIEKGRVGFFKGAGLFIKFKPQTGLEELRIDTSGNEDDNIIYFYNYIISGEADKELEPFEEAIEDHTPIICPTCSAPYREEILRGQTSVKCIYCGTVIKV